MKRILQGTLLLAWYMIAVNATDQDIPKESTALNSSTEKKEPIKNELIQQKPAKTEKPKNVLPLKKTLFVNARVNEIIIVITNHKNKQFQVSIKMGDHYTYHHNYPPLKIVCHEKLTPKTSLTKADLETYAAFVFNDNQKTDKYHYISIHEKNKALKRARQSGDISLFNDVCEETIYNP